MKGDRQGKVEEKVQLANKLTRIQLTGGDQLSVEPLEAASRERCEWSAVNIADQPLTRKAFKPQTSQLTPDDGIVVEGQSCMNEAAQTPHMCTDVNVHVCTDLIER